jgi:hypothetical protein
VGERISRINPTANRIAAPKTLPFPVPEEEFVIDTVRTRGLHYGETDKDFRFPLIFLRTDEPCFLRATIIGEGK